LKVAFFSAKHFERLVFDRYNSTKSHSFQYLDTHLGPGTASLAQGAEAVCAFVSDSLGAETLEILAKGGCRLIALRSAGFNHVDLTTAARLGIKVVRVPAYSPHAIAEHTLGLMLCLNRKIHKAYARVREGNFSLDGLVGFDLSSRSVGVVGTGLIGALVARSLLGLGCRVLAYDPQPRTDLQALGVSYLSREDLLEQSDIITLHCPLTPATKHLIDAAALRRMRKGAMLINTGRGGLVDTKAVIEALKSGHLGYLGLDVYEEEADLFFEDLSGQVIDDDVFARLLTFPNVLITGHQAFLTDEALAGIAQTTLQNLTDFECGNSLRNEVVARN